MTSGGARASNRSAVQWSSRFIRDVLAERCQTRVRRLSKCSSRLAAADLHIIDLINKSRGEIAYTLLDVEGAVPAATLAGIAAIDGVLMARAV